MSDHVLSGSLELTRGVIGRYPDEGERYVLDFGETAPRAIHMLGVAGPLRVTWMDGEDVVESEVLEPWVGLARHRADRVIEERP